MTKRILGAFALLLGLVLGASLNAGVIHDLPLWGTIGLYMVALVLCAEGVALWKKDGRRNDGPNESA